MKQKNPWIPTSLRKINSPDVRLFCLPFAGGSSFSYRSIERYISPKIDMFTIELPGHGTRMNEVPIDRIEELVPRIVYGIQNYLDIPFVFFGHSMGALLAFEISRYLESHYQKKAEHLFLSAMRAPHLPSKFPLMASLPKDDFLKNVKQLEELPENVLKSPEMLDMFLNIMRTDFALCENHSISNRASINTPIFAFCGSQDTFAIPDDVKKWDQYTNKHFEFKLLKGKHLFCKSSGKEIAETINQIMQSDNG
jgi:medium-chain acyl-[acyl-carrier-protein] hydrolase